MPSVSSRLFYLLSAHGAPSGARCKRDFTKVGSDRQHCPKMAAKSLGKNDFYHSFVNRSACCLRWFVSPTPERGALAMIEFNTAACGNRYLPGEASSRSADLTGGAHA